jgi:glycosyltransferase involved in cell wall biosynthesis
VVSSRFPHAAELLGDGTGLLVERQDPGSIAAAVRRVLTEPGLAGRLCHRAAILAPDLTWRAVAGQYLQIGEDLGVIDRPGGPADAGSTAVVA